MQVALTGLCGGVLYKDMKKYIKNKLMLGGVILGVLLFSLLVVNQVKAQTATTSEKTTSVRVATINVYNAKIISQSADSIKVGFDIFNRVGIQPDVRYSIALLQKLQNGGRALFNQKVYDEVLSLGENQTIHREVTYNFPPTNGQYEVWVISASSDAFPFGQGFAGTYRH